MFSTCFFPRSPSSPSTAWPMWSDQDSPHPPHPALASPHTAPHRCVTITCQPSGSTFATPALPLPLLYVVLFGQCAVRASQGLGTLALPKRAWTIVKRHAASPIRPSLPRGSRVHYDLQSHFTHNWPSSCRFHFSTSRIWQNLNLGENTKHRSNLCKLLQMEIFLLRKM